MLTDGEKLIVHIGCALYDRVDKLMKHLDIEIDDDEIDTSLIRKVLVSGHYWALKDRGGIFAEEVAQEIVDEVNDILEMWVVLENSYKGLSDEDKKAMKKESVRFDGFDGNNEGKHRSIALFSIKTLDHFPEFQGRELNTHCQVLDEYREMLVKFNAIGKKAVLSLEEIAEIVSLAD